MKLLHLQSAQTTSKLQKKNVDLYMMMIDSNIIQTEIVQLDSQHTLIFKW